MGGNSSSEMEQSIDTEKSVSDNKYVIDIDNAQHINEIGSYNMRSPPGQYQNENQSVVTITAAPPKFITKNDFIMSWFSWKDTFFRYIKDIDKTEINKHMWGIMLLNRMGPIGQEIRNTFVFSDENAKENIDVLIKKFDVYCMFEDKRKTDYENIDEYVNHLKLVAITHNHSDPMSIVKEKIIQDIKAHHITEKVNFLTQQKENVILYLESLDFNDIIIFWKQCEDLMAQEDHEEILKQCSANVQSDIFECVRCGTQHKRSQCPAWGTQCNKCKQLNHFAEQCKIVYVNDCLKCGTNHILSRCPAFGQLCIKCGKRNHFSWKCQTLYINNCSKCGTHHISFMCPARGQICIRCNKLNHFKEQCTSKLDHTK